MGGHGHGEPYKVPDPSIYKVENVAKLVEVKEALARQGLKDPWLRNEVWRYDAKQFGTHASRLRAFMLRGFVLGLGLTAATVACETFLGGDDHHGHGHDEHH
ncbi:NADH dehydrogenase [ubiquinone] 1 beta subcomplex subunit 3 [Lucilia sericata]|uniref:NADH dehydrogenase [ubiquinone] 1 beta subcomplex subunit 3 n=1 Tax=Lucilia sericata TaxID=13632 RepID=UPI0018A7F303|nr:NADH dehydrogenase [ubiquinone] 1 beta subcomplex subunit 3 [Lucilia sericata]